MIKSRIDNRGVCVEKKIVNVLKDHSTEICQFYLNFYEKVWKLLITKYGSSTAIKSIDAILVVSIESNASIESTIKRSIE